MYLEKDARTVLLLGINKVADFVARTMGPGGKVINIKRGGNNHLTKDGVTVARDFVVQDPAEQVGVDFIVAAAQKTLHAAGDGTTTTTVMARAMMLDAHQRLSLKQLNTTRIVKELVGFSELAIKHIQAQSVQVALNDIASEKLLLDVATISANGDREMANMCLDAIRVVGPEPHSVAFIEAEYDEVDSISFSKGLKLPSRVGGEILGPYTRRTLNKTGDNGAVAVLIVKNLDQQVSLTKDLGNFLNALFKNGHGVLFVAKEPASNLKTMLVNGIDKFNTAFISPSLHGNKYIQLCEDIITLTGATLVDGHPDDTQIYLGYTKSVEIVADSMTLVNPAREDAPEHEALIGKVKAMLETETNAHSREMLKDRIARLTNGVASIRVTSTADADMYERLDRYDDALRAICTALKTGVVRGGGAAYLSATYQLMAEEVDPLDQERKIARDLMETALTAPFCTIAMNALNYIPRIDGKSLVAETTMTIDAWTGEKIDAYENGILDPLGVQVTAIKSAVHATGVFLNTGGMYNGRNGFM